MSAGIDKANPARIDDYMLGGHHNFEVDRIAAQYLLQAVPSYKIWARINRWFLQLIAEQWAHEGYDQIIDLGSGMPTQGHFHTMVPKAKVLYTEIDPVTVAYAREVIGDNPDVVYIEMDLRNPVELLPAAERLFDKQRPVAIGVIGISYMLDDSSLKHLTQMLYDWAAPGSILALTYFDVERTADIDETLDTVKNNLTQVFARNESQIESLLSPWKIQDLRPLTSWLGDETLLTKEDRGNTYSEMFGVIFNH